MKGCLIEKVMTFSPNLSLHQKAIYDFHPQTVYDKTICTNKSKAILHRARSTFFPHILLIKQIVFSITIAYFQSLEGCETIFTYRAPVVTSISFLGLAMIPHHSFVPTCDKTMDGDDV